MHTWAAEHQCGSQTFGASCVIAVNGVLFAVTGYVVCIALDHPARHVTCLSFLLVLPLLSA